MLPSALHSIASPPASAAARLALYVAVAVLLGAMIGWAEDALAARSLHRPAPPLPARLDTTEADTPDLDSTEASTGAVGTDTVAVPVERYLPAPALRRPQALFPRRPAFLGPRPSAYRIEQALDSTGSAIVIREQLGAMALREPLRVDRRSYRRARLERSLHANWQALAEERTRRRQDDGRGGLGMSIEVPGGRQSAFTTIFGQPQVDLRITGQADINAGFDYRKSDQQVALTGQAGRLDPTFQQQLRLGIAGTVGDKMQVDVNWDTNNRFEYQNQVKLQYTGYDDEILQSVEAGHVFLETPSTLIRGGQSLFGIKSEFQLGNLQLTTVASQQEGRANSLTIEGGAESSQFTLRPVQYDDNRHFFLSYYFRNRWNEAHANPPYITREAGFDRITDVEVWVSQTRPDAQEENVRLVAAVVDLGEEPEVLDQQDAAYDRVVRPRAEIDRYDAAELGALQNGQLPQVLSEADYATGKFRRLEAGTDYTFDDQLGYLSLRQRLQDGQALAVAFRYRYNGQSYEVGELTGGGGTTGGVNAERIVLKLLRPSNPTQPSAGQGQAAWYLQLRNIYPLPGSNFRPENFELEVSYAPPGQSVTRNTLPELNTSETLLQLLGLDRLNENRAQRPDNRFDFVDGFTIDAQEGLLIFPYLQPFGRRMVQVIEQGAASSAAQENLKELYAFPGLYEKKQALARQENTRLDVYRIDGAYQGLSQNFYDLNAIFGLVEGSVRVTSGGTTLEEGTDYQVDYQGGTVTITNRQFLADGRDLSITYEQNAAFQVQQKTLLGARADYAWRDRLALGATVMRLSEKAVVDKFRVGEEPISNTIWGVDGSVNLAPRWLTRAVDALPLVQTRAPSALSISGEFAQFRPGYAQTSAFERTRRGLQDQGRDFYADELEGISYIDDFEGFENTFPLTSQLRNWQISAPPATYRPPAALDTVAVAGTARSRWRGTLAWYQLNQNIVEQLEGKAEAYDPAAVDLVNVREIFPNRDTRGQINNTFSTLDLYFDPQMRGPYNYTRELGAFRSRPEHAWGGMTQRLPQGYNDFGLQNIEFVEFIFKPFPENPGRDAGKEAVLYLNLGSISEDVIPDGRLSTEDGLSLTSFNPEDFSTFGIRLPDSGQNTAIDIREGRTEDLGLDGLVSYAPEDYPEIAREAFQFRSFIEAARSAPGVDAAAVARIENDPSGDDYHYFDDDDYFGNDALFPGGASFQQRFTRFYPAHELNTYEAQNRLATSGSGRGNAREPDSEDLNFNAAVDVENNYFQYELPLSRAALDSLARPEAQDDFVVSKNDNGWYLVRIPVRTEERRTVGNIRDFSRIESVRLWTTGHEAPVTLRFATLELVGSQWRKSANVPLRRDTSGVAVPPGASSSRLTVASINNEENDDVYEVPYGTVVPQAQTTSGRRQNTREQSLVLQVEELGGNEQRAIFKTVGNLNLLKYANLRMFAHLHGQDDGLRLREEDRGRLRLFIRLGANETSDFYEYEQPLTPTPPDPAALPDELWRPEENSVNLVLSALNQLKVARDQAANIPSDSLIYTDAEGVPGLPAPDFAPPGTRLGIKGNPSLQNISTLVIGVRNGSGEPLDDATVWINELRVTGYDAEGGWAALASAEVQLADLGYVSANFERQTDGFGALSSTLSNRRQNDLLNWSVLTRLNADKLLPERYGWTIPLTFQLRSQSSTPRYAPSRGDVRLAEILNQIDDNDNLSDAEQQARKEAVVRRAQTASMSRSLTARLQKQGSESWWVRNTLDALSLSYSYSDAQARSPQQRLDTSWRWNSSLQYRLGIAPHTLRPLWFLSGVPLLGALGELRFNYAPQSVSFGASAARRFSNRQARSSDPLQALLPERLRAQHRFTFDRSFDLQYNPFEFLNLNLGLVTDQNLSALSADTLYSVVYQDPDAPEGFRTRSGFSTEREAVDFAEEQQADGLDAFTQDRLDPLSTGTVMQRIFSEVSPRTEGHQQRFTATLRPNLFGGEAFNWITLDDISYQATFGWRSGPVGRQQGAQVSNNMQVRGGLTLHPRRLWQKTDFYRRLEAQAAEGADPSAPADTSAAAEDGDDDGGSLLGGLLRRAVLAVTGIDNLSLTYTGTRDATSTNVTRGGGSHAPVAYGLLGALRGEGLPLSYRFGLDRSIDPSRRLTDSNLEVYDLFGDGNQLRGRALWSPSQSLQISLNWNLDWASGSNVTYSMGENDQITRLITENGSHSASVWAFGASYGDLFARQLETLAADVAAAPADTLGGDGRVVLTNQTLTDDFTAAYLSGPGPVDARGLLPFPMPGWTVTYSGLGQWPLLRFLMQSATLRHSYQAAYQSSYRTNAPDVADSPDTFTLGSRTVEYRLPAFEAGGLSVQERYQPLIGVDVNWKGGLEMNLAWNKRNTYRLSTGTSRVTERRANELTFSASYRKTGLRLPFLPRLENRISLSLTVSHVTNDEQRFLIKNALEEALTDPGSYDVSQALAGENISPIEETSRLLVTPRIGYQISNRVQMDFLMEYERFNGDSQRPSYTNINGGVNVRVSISN